MYVCIYIVYMCLGIFWLDGNKFMYVCIYNECIYENTVCMYVCMYVCVQDVSELCGVVGRDEPDLQSVEAAHRLSSLPSRLPHIVHY